MQRTLCLPNNAGDRHVHRVATLLVIAATVVFARPAEDYRLDPQRFGVWGSSAGGHLVALVGTSGDVKAFDVGAHLDQTSRVQAVCDFFGPTDFVVFVTTPGYEHHGRGRGRGGRQARGQARGMRIAGSARNTPPPASDRVRSLPARSSRSRPCCVRMRNGVPHPPPACLGGPQASRSRVTRCCRTWSPGTIRNAGSSWLTWAMGFARPALALFSTTARDVDDGATPDATAGR